MDPRPLRRFASGLAVLALIATSCAASVSSPETESGAANLGNAASAQEADAVEGPTAPVLVGLADGGQLDWNSLEGKDVMLWFWAPW